MHHNFTCFMTPIDEDFEQFIILKIYQETSWGFNIVKISHKLNPDSFRNVFIYNNHEIDIQKIKAKQYNIIIYPLINYTYKTPNIKFGCELETCFKLECIKDKDKYNKLQKVLDATNELEYNYNRIYYVNW